MGLPAAFPEANLTLVAAPGDEEQVGPLPVRRADGAIVSCWRLDPDELAEILVSGCVWLSVLAPVTAPPVMVTGRKADVLP